MESQKYLPLTGPLIDAIVKSILKERALSGKHPDRMFITPEQWRALEKELGTELRDLTVYGVKIKQLELIL
jgi:hypothetical protein